MTTARHAKHWPDWLKALVAFFIFTFAVLIAVMVATPESSAPKPSQEIAACVEEDGSNSPNPCYWDGGENGKGDRYIIWNDNMYKQESLIVQ